MQMKEVLLCNAVVVGDNHGIVDYLRDRISTGTTALRPLVLGAKPNPLYHHK